MRFSRQFLASCVCGPFVLLAATIALAHDPGLSAAEVRVGSESIIAQVSFASSDLEALLRIDRNHDGRMSREEFDAARDALGSLGRSSLELIVDGQVIEVSRAEATLDDAGDVWLQITYNHLAASGLVIRSPVIDRLPRGHRQFISVIDRSGAIVIERLIDPTDNRLEVPNIQTNSNSILATIREFVFLGLRHILTGYDHLAFLLGLLVVGTTLKQAAAIITSFTVAHSVTLALAALEIVYVSPALVEPVIAVSLVYVGVENLRRRDMSRRWLVTFCFGLVHGFGFASVLRDLRIGTGSRAIVALFSFNSGVEIGQMAIAAVLLPIIWRLRMRERFASLMVPACSILILLFGSYWLVQRLQ